MALVVEADTVDRSRIHRRQQLHISQLDGCTRRLRIVEKTSVELTNGLAFEQPIRRPVARVLAHVALDLSRRSRRDKKGQTSDQSEATAMACVSHFDHSPSSRLIPQIRYAAQRLPRPPAFAASDPRRDSNSYRGRGMTTVHLCLYL